MQLRFLTARFLTGDGRFAISAKRYPGLAQGCFLMK